MSIDHSGATEIIISASVRAFAEQALEAGRRPICVDLFGDRDLRQRLQDHNDQLEFHQVRSFSDAAALTLPNNLPVVLAGGAENCQLLRQKFRQKLSQPQVLHWDRQKPLELLTACHDTGFSVPDWALTAPTDQRQWLAKNSWGSGGTHVKPAQDADSTTDYFQRRIDGVPVSAVFQANKHSCELLGMTRLFSGLKELHAPGYLFCGNSGPEIMADWVESTALSVGLFSAQFLGIDGCFGIDFIKTTDQLLPIDWNLRQPASQELLQLSQRYSIQQPIIRWVLYAQADSVVSQAISDRLMSQTRKLNDRLPDFWLADIPCAGEKVAAMTPYCSVYILSSTTHFVVAQINSLLPAEVQIERSPGFF